MINFSGIDANSGIGSFLRKIAKFFPRNIPLPILQGPLRGSRWILGSGVLGYWLGSYELEKQKVFTSLVKPGDVVFDVGAQAGFYTLLAAKLVGPAGKVFSFEPFPNNFDNIKKHLSLNGVENVIALKVAVADKEGEAGFATGESTSTGYISESGGTRVKTESLDGLLAAGKILSPKIIKMDIEGAEFMALSGAKNILEKNKPTILLATHGAGVKKQCMDLLTLYGYEFSSPKGTVEDSDELVAEPKR